MKALIFNGSPRENGGTATLKELTSNLTGEVNVINSYKANISPCIDCRYCWTNDSCALNDEMQLVYRLIDEAGNIIIASPIYFGEITGSLLGLMSRLQCYYIARKFRNTEMLSIKERNGALILVDGGDGYVDNAMSMGKRLLRKMKSEFIDYIYFSATENVPKNNTVVPKYILAEIKELSINLSQIPKEETDEERHARIYPIILSEYNPAWHEWYIEEKTYLQRLIGEENITRISHIGSTSVPELMAKPTIDILLEIKESADIEKLKAALPSSEYICLCDAGLTMPTPPPHLMFLKGYTPTGFAEKVYHIHVRYHGDWDELYFRDYLIAHPETAVEYAELKVTLHKEYEHDRDGYTNAKGEFIRVVTQKTKRHNQTRSFLGKTVTVTIDRPIGTAHPKHSEIVYPINYGFIAGEIAPDGEDLDAYVLGVDKPLHIFTGKVIGIIERSDDVEDKLIVAPEGKMFSQNEIAEAVRFQEQFYHSTITCWG